MSLPTGRARVAGRWPLDLDELRIGIRAFGAWGRSQCAAVARLSVELFRLPHGGAPPGGGARVTMDFLGFGLSDKPRPHRYSLREQAELVQAVVAETTSNPVALIAHDMGTSVATELLVRDLDGHLPFELQAAVLSNGSVILDRASLRPIQNVLHGPLARSSRAWRIAACSVVASPDCSVRTIRCPRRKQRRNGRYCPTTGVTASRTC